LKNKKDLIPIIFDDFIQSLLMCSYFSTPEALENGFNLLIEMLLAKLVL